MEHRHQSNMKYKMICLDMDGVLLNDTRNTWMEVHKAFGTLEEGLALTEKYLHTDYNRLVKEVVGRLWKGRNATAYIEICERIPFMKGIEELFLFIKENQLVSTIISGGSMRVARRIDSLFEVDHVYANELIITDGKVSGEFIWPVGVGHGEKARIVRHLAQDYGISLDEIIFVGDSENDVDAFGIAGLAIAFNTTDERVRKAAHVVVESNDLQDVVDVIQAHSAR